MTPDPDEELDAAYLFADPAPPAEPPAPEPPRKRKKRRRPGDPAPPPAPQEIGDRILNRADETTPPGWWKVPAALIAVGLLLCLVPIIVLAVKQGAAVGGLVLVGVSAAVLVQIAVVTAILAVVGTFFGIDYGPATQAVVKLAAVVALVDGLTGAMLLVNPCAMVMAVVIGCGVFQYLFRLSVTEMILSVALMVGVAWGVNTFVVLYFVSKGQPPKALLSSGFQLRSDRQGAMLGLLSPPGFPSHHPPVLPRRHLSC